MHVNTKRAVDHSKLDRTARVKNKHVEVTAVLCKRQNESQPASCLQPISAWQTQRADGGPATGTTGKSAWFRVARGETTHLPCTASALHRHRSANKHIDVEAIFTRVAGGTRRLRLSLLLNRNPCRTFGETCAVCKAFANTNHKSRPMLHTGSLKS